MLVVLTGRAVCCSDVTVTVVGSSVGAGADTGLLVGEEGRVEVEERVMVVENEVVVKSLIGKIVAAGEKFKPAKNFCAD